MHQSHAPSCVAAAAAVVALFLAADKSPAQTATNAIQLQNGRLLAAACMQCHSSSGFEGITGESASEIVSELREMKTTKSPGIMQLIARGYTDPQVQDIAAYLASLPRESGGGDGGSGGNDD